MTPRTPLPLRLRTTRRSVLFLLLASAAFVVAGFVALPIEPAAAYGIAFFGLGVVVATIQLLPNSSYLELDARGFTTCTMFRKSFMPWTDVGEFFPYKLEGRARDMVAFRFAPTYQRHATARKFLTTLAGVEAALPDEYGKSAEELAALLNKIRSEQVGSPRHDRVT